MLRGGHVPSTTDEGVTSPDRECTTRRSAWPVLSQLHVVRNHPGTKPQRGRFATRGRQESARDNAVTVEAHTSERVAELAKLETAILLPGDPPPQ